VCEERCEAGQLGPHEVGHGSRPAVDRLQPEGGRRVPTEPRRHQPDAVGGPEPDRSGDKLTHPAPVALRALPTGSGGGDEPADGQRGRGRRPEGLGQHGHADDGAPKEHRAGGGAALGDAQRQGKGGSAGRHHQGVIVHDRELLADEGL